MRYLGYSIASACLMSWGDTVDQVREHFRGDDEFLIVFDAGDQADHIWAPMNAHRVIKRLKTTPVVWRGENELAQRAFRGVVPKRGS